MAPKHALYLLLFLMGCGEPSHEQGKHFPAAKGDPPPRRFASTVELPGEQPGMNTARRDLQGKPVRVACITCHRLVRPKKENAMVKQLKGFHRGVKVDHGDLTCRSCHQPPEFSSFRLATGATIPYRRVMELCGQCHSRQRSDYRQGIHGGMTGHWDLNRGPRRRNHCIHCHSPHRPRIPQVMPAPRPRYRGQP